MSRGRLGDDATSNVTESETNPLIRFADLSPARRGTAKEKTRPLTT